MVNDARSQYRRRVEESFPEGISLVDNKALETAVVAALRKELASTGHVVTDHFLENTARTAIEAGTLVDYAKGGEAGIQLRYGLNPGQPAAFYAERGASGPNVSQMKVLKDGGKGLGYINVGDADLALTLVERMHNISPNELHCTIVKHEIPAGVAKGRHPEEVYKAAWEADSLSNFGGVVTFSYEVNGSMAYGLSDGKRNTELVLAPSFTPEALRILESRKPLRVVQVPSFDQPSVHIGLSLKGLNGGLLLQHTPMSKINSPGDLDVASAKREDGSMIYSLREATEEQRRAAVFQWNIAYWTRSNAVVFGSESMSYGIGAGQQSRIDSARIAGIKSKRGNGSRGTVMASDAFMPFDDVVELAAELEITAIVYPLGSTNDAKVIERANNEGIAMLATRRPGETDCERGFYHR